MYEYDVGLNFDSLMGPVFNENIMKSLWLAFEGMVGIFIVMGLIYLVVILLNIIFNKKKKDYNKNYK